jgi:hypothetical protein
MSGLNPVPVAALATAVNNSSRRGGGQHPCGAYHCCFLNLIKYNVAAVYQKQSGCDMHLKDEQIHRLGEKILNDLAARGEIVLKSERGAALAAIKKAISADLQGEESLERDAERILEENLKALGKGAVAIDRHKMLRMIKEKLARDRKIVL